MPKHVIMTLFFVFAGTPSIVVPSGHLVSLNSVVGQTFLDIPSQTFLDS